jgi:hypothetical protein
MKDWLDKVELLDSVAQARRDAYTTAPRTSNDHLEAAYFLAMLAAVDRHYGDSLKDFAPEAEDVPVPVRVQEEVLPEVDKVDELTPVEAPEPVADPEQEPGIVEEKHDT